MTIPTPERGQPIDTNYIYQIVEAVNKLTEKITPATNKYLTIDTDAAGKQHSKVSESRIIGGSVSVAPGIEVKAGDTRSFTYSFNNDFKFAPIVSATIVNQTETLAGKNAIVIITSITTSGVTGFVRFNENGTANIVVHLLMIGIPN